MDFNDIDLQWFAEDDDDTTNGPSGVDVTTLFDDDESNDPEILGEETYKTDTDSEFTTLAEGREGQETNLDTGRDQGDRSIESAWWSDSDDAQELKEDLNHDYSHANTETRNADGSVNRDWMHNAYATANRAKDAVKDKVAGLIDSGNRMLGGTTNGYTSADLERNKEAREAKATYNNYINETKAALDNLKNSKTYDPEKDRATVEQLEKELADYEGRRNAIDGNLHSSDTGSRLQNAWENVKEDAGDVGTRINQFFGGANQYGLGAKGQINDRNGDGKVSVSERLLNMGRDAGNWAKEQLTKLGTSAIATSMGPLG